MKTNKWTLRVLAMVLTAVMGIIEPAGPAFAGELSDPSETVYTEDLNIKDNTPDLETVESSEVSVINENEQELENDIQSGILETPETEGILSEPNVEDEFVSIDSLVPDNEEPSEGEDITGSYKNLIWRITSDGVLYVSGSGNPLHIDNNKVFGGPGSEYKDLITKAIVSIEDADDLAGMFMGYKKLKTVDFRGSDLSHVTNMKDMFNGCEALTSVNFTGTDFSQVRTMEQMFQDCKSLIKISFSGLDTSNVRSLKSMFSRCSNLRSADFGECDLSKVNNMSYMFFDCNWLLGVDLSTPSKAKDLKLNSMFFDCWRLQEPDLSFLDGTNPESMSLMFYRNSFLYELDFSKINSPFVGVTLCDNLETLYLPYGITSIGCRGCTSLKDVYFQGTEEECEEFVKKNTKKEAMSNNVNNEPLLSATFHCIEPVITPGPIPEPEPEPVPVQRPFDPADYVPTELAKNDGFRVDNVEVGSYSVKITFTVNKTNLRTCNYKSLYLIYYGYINYDGLDDEDIYIDYFIEEEQFSILSTKDNHDNTVTRTIMASGVNGGKSPLVPGKLYYWKIVGFAGYNRKAQQILRPVLSGYNTMVMDNKPVMETHVSVEGAPELVETGATVSEVRFKINNPYNEELVRPYVSFTANGGWSGISTAEPREDGYYYATVDSGFKTAEVTGNVMVETGDTYDNIEQHHISGSEKIAVTPTKLTADNVKLKIKTVKEVTDEQDSYMEVYVYAEVDSVKPIDDGSLILYVADERLKRAKETDEETYNEEFYGFRIIESRESPTGWKAVSKINDSPIDALILENADKAWIRLVVQGSMDKDSGEEWVSYPGETIINKVVKCIESVDVTSFRFKNEAVEIPEGTAYTLEPEITPANATDKTLEYTSSDPSVATVSSTGVVSAKKAGTTVITAKAADGSNVESSNSVTVTVVEVPKEEEPEEDEPDVPEEDKEDENYSEENIWVTAIDDSGIFYTGKAVKPAVRVYDGNRQLAEKVDYTLTYKNNTKVYETKDGKFDEKTAPTVLVKLKGDYSGEKTVLFQIHPSDTPAVLITGAEVVWPEGKSEFDYKGTAICPKPGLKADGKELEAGKDYSISYQNNLKAGKATVIFTGQGNCTGEKKVQFTIKPLNLTDNNVKVNGGSKSIIAVYSAGGAKPALKVTYGEGDEEVVLKEGIDYKVSYSNNKEVTTEKTRRQPTANLSGIGCCTGKLPVEFKILKCDFANGVTVFAEDKVVGKKSNQYSTKIKVTDKSGSVLRAGKDYESAIAYYAYDPATGERGNRLDKTSFPQAGSMIRVEVTGKGNYSNEKAIGYYRILPTGNDISKAKVKISDQTFAGKGKAVTIPEEDKQFSVTLGNQTLHLVTNENEDGFMIVPGSYVNNTKKGTAKVTIRGTGSFGGTKTVSFKIVPKSTAGK